MISRLHVACIAAGASVLIAAVPARAGSLIINNVGSITDSNVLGAIDTAISNTESLYTTGNGAGNVTLNVNFSYNSAAAGNLASSDQYFYGYSYTNYASALTADSTANAGNTNLTTAVAHLSAGNSGNMAVTFGQALLLSQYGLSTPNFIANDSVNINSSVTNWNFTGTATSSQYDAIGAIEHELDELLGIGGGGSVLGDCSSGNFFCTYNLGATDLYRYSAPGTPSTSTSSTYLSIDGGVTSVVAFNGTAGGDFGDFAPACGPTSNNVGNDQYIQNAFNCTGLDENYSTLSPEYVATTAIGWDPASQSMPVPEPACITVFGGALLGLARLHRRGKAKPAT
jgi:hypothetical protein